MKLHFLGGASEVTGSCYLVETESTRFIVDCGMFQGGHGADLKNSAPFDFDPERIDFVLLTHAHIDHSGRLPRLCAQGFRGPIYATTATVDLAEVILLDSAHIQQKEAEWQQRMPKRKHQFDTHQEPLYSVAQAQVCISQLRGVNYGIEFNPRPAIRCRFRDAGHILGAAIIEVWVESGGQVKKFVFSGDIGHAGKPVVRDPEQIESADILLIESTYGNRLHKSLADTLSELEFVLNDTLGHRHGNVVVPAFAVGRTQDLLYLLTDLYRQGRLPQLNVYVDSPMALKATEITLKHASLLDAETRAMLDWMRSNREHTRIHFVQDVRESMALSKIKSGAVIISASGMCDAGRIRHHLANNLGRKECAIMITGFQARNTLGRRIVDGVKKVRIFGDEIPVRAKIYTIGGLSAHADQAGLLEWMHHFRNPPQQTFIVHGEMEIALEFCGKVRQSLNWNVAVPAQGELVTI
jgi:metallo-beta-lactamase family protein